ncbi:MAG: hypothetical protein WCR71_07010 [Bacteroidales bacterium]
MERKLTTGLKDFIDDQLFYNLINNTKEDLSTKLNMIKEGKRDLLY